MPLIPLIAGAAKLIGGAVAGRAVKKAATAVGSAVTRAVGAAASRPVLTSVAGAAAGAAVTPIINRVAGGGIPSLPAGFAPQGGGARAPVPREGVVGRTISRILPGGMTGREFTPVDGVERDKYGRPIAVFGERAERWVGPRGYVLVRDPANPDAEPVFLLKGAARAMGLWSPRPKPPVSGWDMRAIQRASAASKRVKKLAGKVGFTCAKKGRKC